MTQLRSTALDAGRWQLITSLSSAGFAARNFGLKTVCGTVPVSAAWVDVSQPGDPVHVHAVLDLAGIDSGHQRRDADLRKPRLLDTQRYPHLHFDGIARYVEDGWQVTGRLAGRATADVGMRAEITRRAPDGSLAVRACTTIDRRALGVRAPRFMIGREVAITIDAVFAAPDAGGLG